MTIGIYKITNLINGRFYIGQSKNIERRFYDHRSKGHSRNTSMKLRRDVQKYGKDNFSFEIIEECPCKDLLVKEKEYINKLQPYYNTVNKNDGEFNQLVSEGTKRWWKNLDEETKNKIKKNNLIGPKKGHEVSKETREKISKSISEVQGKRVRIVETGQVFEKVMFLEEYLGACTGTYAAYKKGKIKSVKGYQVEEV